ncbi:hypothetical protein LCGC14_1229370 [marine sediment metagenome]|uniref:HTH arsR-type domain-containing protein n=1 Tax=marine sediment metagenome TaxID=412755 RepID=A0A0F9NRA8_9ZZZZ
MLQLKFNAIILNHMVEYNSDKLDAVFYALSDPTRRAMLITLADRKTCTVSELAEPFDMSFAAASKHVKVLEKASLLTRKVDGRKHFCTFSADRLDEAKNWMDFYKKYWSERLDALEALLQHGENNG